MNSCRSKKKTACSAGVVDHRPLSKIEAMCVCERERNSEFGSIMCFVQVWLTGVFHIYKQSTTTKSRQVNTQSTWQHSKHWQHAKHWQHSKQTTNIIASIFGLSHDWTMIIQTGSNVWSPVDVTMIFLPLVRVLQPVKTSQLELRAVWPGGKALSW